MPAFKGIPVSSKSQMDVPVQVVSQATSEEYANIEAASVQSEGETGQTPKEAPKTEAVRSGKIKVADLTSADFDDFMHSSIVAIPKTMPSMLDVRAKDPNFRLRWVNFKADGGRQVDERKAQGFVIAKPEEVMTNDGKSLDGSIMIHPDGIKYHDVVCMKVPTLLLYGWYKANALESAAKVAPKRIHQKAKEEGMTTLRQGIANEGRNYNELKDLISVYVPGESDVSSK